MVWSTNSQPPENRFLKSIFKCLNYYSYEVEIIDYHYPGKMHQIMDTKLPADMLLKGCVSLQTCFTRIANHTHTAVVKHGNVDANPISIKQQKWSPPN